MRKTRDFFGHIDSLTFEEIKALTSDRRFIKICGINKDKIAVCKDCEYRYMCVDKRIPKLNNGVYEYDTETDCGYDPYTGKWKE